MGKTIKSEKYIYILIKKLPRIPSSQNDDLMQWARSHKHALGTSPCVVSVFISLEKMLWGVGAFERFFKCQKIHEKKNKNKQSHLWNEQKINF